MPCATVTQTLPRRLHSTQTLSAGIRGLRPLQERGEDLEQLALVDRAAAQLEVDRRRGRRSGWSVASVSMYSGWA